VDEVEEKMTPGRDEEEEGGVSVRNQSVPKFHTGGNTVMLKKIRF